MKNSSRFFILTVFGICSLFTFSFSVHAGVTTANETKSTDPTTIRLLTIGNSFSQDAVEYFLSEMAQEVNVDLIIGNLYIAGCSLERHYNNSVSNATDYSYRKMRGASRTIYENKTLLEGVLDEPWDYISIQQASPNSGLPNTYQPYMNNLISYIRQHQTGQNPTLILHQTWAYAWDSSHSGFASYGNNQLTMYQAIMNTVQTMATGNAEIGMVVPAGTAIQNGRSSLLGDIFCRDGYHLSVGLGRYTAACTWFEKILGVSVLGNAYMPAGVSEMEKELAQIAAHHAVLEPWEVTPMTNFPYTDDNTVALTNPIKINMADATTHPQWNNITDRTSGNVIGLLDVNGNNSEIIVRVTSPFGGINRNGPAVTSTILDMPDEVSKTSFYGNTLPFNDKTSPLAALSFTHLNKSYEYDFVFFSSRTATDNREMYFATQSEGTEKKVYFNPSSNTNKLAELKSIKPDENGEIEVSMSIGPNNNNANRFFYLNAMQLSGKLINTSINPLHTASFKVIKEGATYSIESAKQLETVVIYNQLGQKVTQLHQLKVGINRLPIEQQATGVYFIQAGNEVIKFLKEEFTF